MATTKKPNAVDRTFLVSGDARTSIVLAIYTSLRQDAFLVQSENPVTALKARERLMEAARLIAQARVRPIRKVSNAERRDAAIKKALSDQKTFPGQNGNRRDATIAQALTAELGIKVSPSLVRTKRESKGVGRPRKTD